MGPGQDLSTRVCYIHVYQPHEERIRSPSHHHQLQVGLAAVVDETAGAPPARGVDGAAQDEGGL